MKWHATPLGWFKINQSSEFRSFLKKMERVSMFTVQKAVLLAAVVLAVLITPAHAHVKVDAPNGGESLEVG